MSISKEHIVVKKHKDKNVNIVMLGRFHTLIVNGNHMTYVYSDYLYSDKDSRLYQTYK